MPSVRPTLERIRDRFDPPSGGFQRLVGRRRRRERNQRLAAGALALTLSGAVLAGLFWAFPRGDTPRPGASMAGPLLFSREEPGGGSDLFTMNPDGSGVARLTRTPDAFEGDPAWSPDGTKIAVSLGLGDIAVIDAGTLQVTRLTQDPDALDSSPSWSPDGSKIVFHRELGRAPRDLYVMNADGTGLKRLTDRDGDYLLPSWSPDGTRIAFSGSTPDEAGLYLMDPDGLALTLVIEIGEGHSRPAWSPDGTRIAFDLDGAVHVVNADGSRLRRLSPELPEETFDMDPAWSPDGTRIAFTRWRNDVLEGVGGDGDIWVMNADGTGQTQLTSGPVIDGSPTWRPTPPTTVSPEPSVDPTPTAASDEHTGSVSGAFYPTTHREEGRVVMPVVLVDGSRAELVWDMRLRPNDLGIYGFTSGGLRAIDRTLIFRYAEDRIYAMHSGPLETYEGHVGGAVEVWEGAPGDFPCPNLIYRFGNWFVAVRTCQGQLSEEEKAQWARSLVGRVTQEGFLVLDTRAPLVLQETGGHEGPQLWLQGPDEDGWPFITLTPLRCDPERPPGVENVRTMQDGQKVSLSRTGNTSSAVWCEDGLMFVQVESPDQEYVEGAAQGLRVRNVSLSD